MDVSHTLKSHLEPVETFLGPMHARQSRMTPCLADRSRGACVGSLRPFDDRLFSIREVPDESCPRSDRPVQFFADSHQPLGRWRSLSATRTEGIRGPKRLAAFGAELCVTRGLLRRS